MFHIRKGNLIEIQSNDNPCEPRIWVRAWIDNVNYVQISVCEEDWDAALEAGKQKEAV